ncbi:hypothetical protein P3342_005922 [Pyrenophora teres f. teres]|uniref:Uncharacterized protein n=1 Tax=Pyrenophora teres f. teres TaxID=97479 RepID=A0A6S6VYD9_9PLEO|nr:hypothetical protein HRS9139_00235 [Pyrenophora teres f. teres]KAE8847806.1 hypothetical protein PTNB85_01649 [Pyrenophora teres f. teres]KAE8854037.1 hypothetical protein HRS9122_01029 [Pyrenophora teres f. teres]KAE8867733.1 hypothetical protein PTNB29_01644 [Pyrenophora teres f. teres]KAE8872496.1 hypothetical protein PTNB73_01647 [Pyrenophora teres f. teres]
MAALPKNNAFGAGSPSWNMAFPDGNLTAVEILTYLPHWLKSIDVVDRFVSHGAKSSHIAAIINESRVLPSGEQLRPNSVLVMMQYSMRRAGYEEWSVSTHSEYPQEIPRPEWNLDVTGFRTPCTTHPKEINSPTPQKVKRNQEVEPIEFRDLARYVKMHPCGDDALDLARCVQYAVEHQHESWLFPTHFSILVAHLGGPAIVTHAHLDREAFARRNNYSFSPVRSPKTKNNNTRSKVKTKTGKATFEDLLLASSAQKRTVDGMAKVALDNKRRSGRLVGKQINFAEPSDNDDADKTDFDSPYATPVKKRKLSRLPLTPQSIDDGEFVQYESDDDDDMPAEESSEVETPSPTPTVHGRAAARKARVNIKAAFVEHITPLKQTTTENGASTQKTMAQKPLPAYMNTTFEPEVMTAAYMFSSRQPIRLAPPMLSYNRLKIDDDSIFLYAAPPHTNLDDMYASAYDSARFNGPRRHAPFRELHLLTDPAVFDTSDWAENIRWAKEQYTHFETVWTEYDYYLECITAHRHKIHWVSEEMIRAGMVGF